MLFDLGDTLWYREDRESWEKRENISNQRAGTLLRQYIDTARLPSMDNRTLGQKLRQDFDEQIRTMIRSAPLLEPDVSQAITNVLQNWNLGKITGSPGRVLFEALRVRIPDSRPLFADTISTLTELRQRGFLLGIVTNRLWGGPAFYEDLSTIRLLDYFERKHIAISGDLGMRKPNPRIFEHVLQTFPVSPQETAMIGDSLSADILGAQPLGITAIWKPKPWLSTWALAHVTSRTAHTRAQPLPVSSGTFPGIDTADAQIEELAGAPPGGMYLTDDDYILTRADNSRDYLEQFRCGEIRPDRVIGQLSDLLTIFRGAGQP
ncbi:MAG TPA: HAD family hydrolase [Ktedonobacteraceae bacterium]|nr:HAD family hydrolase [Ktedonobacteraceae bacterium]